MAEQAKEDDVDYESDPEETKLILKMRRREASDDEDEEDLSEEKVKPSRRIVESDVESDGQGGAAEYDEDGGEVEEYVEEEEDDEELIADDEEYVVEEGVGGYEGRSGEVGSVVDAEGGELMGKGIPELEAEQQVLDNTDNMDERNLIDDSNREEGEEEKKENEPYAVPTAGAFYMHDDRFRDNAGGRGRRTFAGRKLWESKDEKKWGHDKFEEFTMQERHYDGGRRSSRGRFRGRGRIRGQERGYSQGNSSRAYNTTDDPIKVANHNNAPRSVRGRGPRRYQPTSFKNSSEPPSDQNQQHVKLSEKSSHSVSARTSTSQSNLEAESAPAKKNITASSLNYASPPFYPSGSSSDVTYTQKRDGHTVTTSQNVRPVADQSFSAGHPGSMPRRKASADSIGMDKLYIDDSLSTVAAKPSIPLQSSVSSSSALISNQSHQSRGQGRGINSLPQMVYQPTGSVSQVNRNLPSAPLHTNQRNQVMSQGQSSGQQFAQSSRGGSQVSSPKASQSESSFEPAEVESPSESNNSKTSLISKGKANMQSSGMGSFLYGGTPVMGASGSLGGGHGDQNFPAFLPVMQFAGQRPGGIGVPAVGMAFPGYVGQPQLGLGNSEMTWLPVLTGAAGALHATYGSPYINADGAYHGRTSGQTSSAPMIKENSPNKPNNDLKPSQRLEVANDDLGQRQKNPRRYTEMKFDH